MKYGKTILIIMAVLLTGCRNGGKSTGFEPHAFPQPKVPSVYSLEEERLGYLLSHYWDPFLATDKVYPTDSLLINGVRENEVEAALSNYLEVLRMSSTADAVKGVAAFYDKLEAYQNAAGGSPDSEMMALRRVASLVEKYLYDPNSPFRNEEFYLPFVKRLAESRFIPDDMRTAYRFDAEMCSLNRLGTPAADFRFRDIRGRDHRLYDVRADYTLLFFSNPGCENCYEIITRLGAMPQVDKLIAAGTLAVVNVYIDEEIDKWADYQDIYPKTWYNGYDPDLIIRKDLIYSVRAIPSLYVLDAEKRVIMKDAPEENVFSFLDNI